MAGYYDVWSNYCQEIGAVGQMKTKACTFFIKKDSARYVHTKCVKSYFYLCHGKVLLITKWSLYNRLFNCTGHKMHTPTRYKAYHPPERDVCYANGEANTVPISFHLTANIYFIITYGTFKLLVVRAIMLQNPKVIFFNIIWIFKTV